MANLGPMRLAALAALAVLALPLSAQAPERYEPDHNPVVARDLPDPGVLRQNETYVLTATSCDCPDRYPLYSSTDLLEWKPEGSVFPPGQPKWARSDFWAPEIHRVGERYVAYYTARDHSGKLCVGAATAQAPLGPFTDIGAPLVRNEQVGIIDAHYFKDEDGRHYLITKEDGNDVGRPTPISIRELAPDGLGFMGKATELITNDLPWEGNLVEAPWMVKRNGTYYLFYSANAFYDHRYATGVARASSLTGPFQKHPEPILHSDEFWDGPGHGSVVTGPDSKDYFVYHSLARGVPGPRMLLVDQIHWQANGWPIVHDGTPSGRPSAEEIDRSARDYQRNHPR